MSASAPSPRPFGPYVLTRPLGSDALGEVWRAGTAGAPRLEPLLLVRTFTSAAVDRASLVSAMETAVQLVEEVRGPAVAKGAVLGVIDDTPFLGVEYVPGRTLDALLAARVLGATMPPEHGLLIAERLLAALEAGAPVERYAGAPHGFLVPAFVSVSNEGETRVFGFGLGAGLLPALKAPRARQAFAPYVAPEVLASGRPSAAGDLYAVGAILFEALTGKPPAPGVALESVDSATLAVDGAPVPEDLRRLLRRALHPDPATRDREPAAYRRDLSALLYGGPYAPSTFNLAFFLQKNFERAIQRETNEIAAELEAAAARPAESTGRRRVEGSGSRRAEAPPPRAVESSGGSRRMPAAPSGSAPRTTGPMRMASEPPKKSALGGVPLWAVAAGAVLVLGVGAFFALRRPAAAPAPVPTPAPTPVPPPPTPVPTAAPVVVGKEDPLFQAAVQKKLDEELRKMEAKSAKEKDAAARKRQAEMDQAEEAAQKTRESEDATRAARDRADREEAARLARETAAKKREEAQAAAAAAAPAAPAVKEGDLVDIDACDTVPQPTRQVSPIVPVMAKQRRISGIVLLRVLIDESGRPAKVELLRDVTPAVGLGAASVQALEQWRWKPATKNGVRVKTWLAVQVPYKN